MPAHSKLVLLVAVFVALAYLHGFSLAVGFTPQLNLPRHCNVLVRVHDVKRSDGFTVAESKHLAKEMYVQAHGFFDYAKFKEAVMVLDAEERRQAQLAPSTVRFTGVEPHVPAPIKKSADRSAGVAPKSVKAGAAAQAAKRKMNTAKQISHHSRGILTPVVELVRSIVGNDLVSNWRSAWIKHHTKTISAALVSLQESSGSDSFARELLANFFHVSDTDNDGYLDEEELKTAFRQLGFTFIEDKNIHGLMARADTNGDGVLDLDEFIMVAPSYLRKNCAKLAAKNGDGLGLLV